MSLNIKHLTRLYDLLDQMKAIHNGVKYLSDCTGKMKWAKRGVYFFFEAGELRRNGDMRVTRVGTHAVSFGSKTSLWDRLRTHRGTKSGKYVNGGNHRGSIFRLHVGSAILNKEKRTDRYPSWGKGSSAKSEIRGIEYPIEQKVSEYIRKMPFAWVEVDDEPSKYSNRAFIESNSIALLSNYYGAHDEKGDIASTNWLGNWCNNEFVRKSGLWNVQHVTDKEIDPRFLDTLEDCVQKMEL